MMSKRTKRILDMDKYEFENEVDQYFENCDKFGQPYLVVGLAQHLKVTRQLLADIRADRVKSFVGLHHKETLLLAHERIELYLAQRLFDKDDKKAVSSIFTLKTQHQWREKEIMDLTNIQEIKINFK